MVANNEFDLTTAKDGMNEQKNTPKED